jgi:RHS repeat-associated protein
MQTFGRRIRAGMKWLGVAAALTASLAATTAIAQSGAAAVSVMSMNATPAFPSQPNGKFTTSAEDLRVKVQGGYVRWTRDFDGNKWRFNANWNNVALEFDQIVVSMGSSGGGGGGGGSAAYVAPPVPPEIFGGTVVPGLTSVSSGGGSSAFGSTASGPLNWISRNGAYFRADADYGSFAQEGGNARYLFRPLRQATGNPAALAKALYPTSMTQFATGAPLLRWSDRQGDWIDFDKGGSVVAYGDKNDVKVTFEYEQSGGYRRVRRVLDNGGNPVIELVYDSANPAVLSEVRDVPAAGDPQPVRSVKYTYESHGSIATVTDVRGNVGSYGYDTRGRLTSLTDPESRVHRVEYGATSRMTKEVNAEGGETDYTYEYDKTKKEFFLRIQYPATSAGRRTEDRRYSLEGELLRVDINGQTEREFGLDGRLVKYLNGRGVQSEFLRDEFDNVISVKHGDGAQLTNSYDARYLNLTQQRDENGVATSFEYDALGNLVRRKDGAGTPDERVTVYARDALGRVTSLTRVGRTETNGTVTPDAVYTFEYDARGNVVRAVDAEGHATLYEYNRSGQVTRETQPNGALWRFTYDADGNLTTSTSPLGHTRAYGYDKVSNFTKFTDARGLVYSKTFDALDRVVKDVDPYGAEFKTEFNRAGRVAASLDAAGKGIRFDYDVFSRPTKATDAKGFDYFMEYLEADGRDAGMRQPSKVKYPTFQRLLQYNERNRPVRKTDLDGTDGRVENYNYDGVGRRKTVTNASGKTYTYEYNPYGQVTRIMDPQGNSARMAYDARGNVVQATDPNGRATRFEYDLRDLMVTETDPLGKVTRYTYDQNGWPAGTRIANGQSIQYGYDSDGRLTSQRELAAAGALVRSITFSYDAEDNLLSWSDGTFSSAISYDDAGRMASETVGYGAFTLSHAYNYHPNNQLKTYTGPDGVTLSYNYDANGQLERISIPNEGDIAVTDWQWVARKKVLLPGGTEQRFDYDGLLMMTRLKVVNPAQATVFDLENKYGQLHEVTEASRDGQPTQYSYDDSLHLTSVQNNTNAALTEGYTVDAAGNRVGHSRTGGSTWVYDAANQLTSRGTVTYTYDAAGNLTRKVDASLPEPLRTTQYEYDAFSRLQRALDGSGAVLASYVYDPFDRRLSKTLGNGKVTYYLHSERGLLAEADAVGQVGTSYGWHPEHEAGSYPLYARVADPASGPSAKRYVYYHNDHIGTPHRITDKSGALVWKAEYDGFGKALINSSAADPVTSNLRFPGQYFDEETGLHYNNRRYFDPDTGRYLTRDPIGFGGGFNQYAYAKHNPSTFTDPTGEIIPCLAYNYLRCMATCMLISTAADAILNCGNINWGDNAKDCAIDCLWDMLPLPNPCGKFGQWAAAAMGAAAGAGFNSFTAGTLVQVRPAGATDGDAGEGTASLRPIGDLKPGDEVLSRSEWKVPAKGADSSLSYERVTEVFTSQHVQTLVHVTLKSGEVISTTAGHPFMTSEGWRDAVLLSPGTRLVNKSAEKHGDPDMLATISSVRIEEAVTQVFNLEVANSHTYFVGEDGQLVHNGNSARIRRDWERYYNKPWPKNPMTERIRPGGNRDAHHIKYRCNGGTDEPLNIEPMTPSEHIDHHRKYGYKPR